MALPPGFLEELRARTPLAAVIGRRVKLARAGRQWKGCCPFHAEKTPSFHVYDDHYHCFGCGAHGDAISFVMQSQGAGFMEAVEQLAAEAGLEVPKSTPDAAAAEQRRHDLHAVLEAAAAAFQRRLFLPEGTRARDYLRGRGFAEETIRRFGLGWSGEGRGALLAELGRQGITPDLLGEAGLLTAPAEDRPARELFFNRVMFPIRDRRGRVISFGGRILGEGQPKYLNGPETALFAKRRTLYGLDLARQAEARKLPVIVVEGYMDVIALHQAGFTSAVAPLGTALTTEQMEAIWKICPVPVLCFDSDRAGERAAIKAVELVLPAVDQERSIKVLFTYQGLDPDGLIKHRVGLIKRDGAAEFLRHLGQAREFRDALFDLLRAGAGVPPNLAQATPEQRTLLRGRIEQAVAQIGNKALAGEYRRSLFNRLFPPMRGKTAQSGPIVLPRSSPDPAQAAAERGRTLLAILLRHPLLLHSVEESLGTLALPPPLDRLKGELLAWSMTGRVLDSSALIAHLHAAGLATEAEHLLSAHPAPLPACAAPDARLADAEEGWWHFFGLMNPQRLEEEVAAASRVFALRPDPAAQRRLVVLCTAREALRRGEHCGLDPER